MNYCNAYCQMNSRIISWITTVFLGACITMAASCGKGDDPIKPVNGVLEGPVATDSIPKEVKKVMMADSIDYDLYEQILNDEAHRIGVYSLLRCSDHTSAQGYGILITYGNTVSVFPNIRHGNRPFAEYDDETGILWLKGADIEGTGVLVERIYQMRFGNNGYAYILSTIDPFDMQEAICQRLGYSIKGKEVTFYDNRRAFTTATNREEKMGGFDSNAIWVGEQMTYSAGKKGLTVHITPGVKSITGLVLSYKDMPTINAHVSVTGKNTFAILDMETIKPDPYVGYYQDEDCRSGLNITQNNDDFHYSVKMDIYRLTNLNDGVGIRNNDGIAFTSTDAAGNPISGLVTLKGDTAIVTFTGSTWSLLPNGSEFKYIRKN